METQLRLTQESPRRRGRPSSVRLSEAARRTGREGVAMARRELERVRNSAATGDPGRLEISHHDAARPHEPQLNTPGHARNAA